MGLQMQIVQDKLEVFDERDERSCFLLFVHGLEGAWNDPLLDLVVSDAFEDKRVKFDQKNGRDLDGLDAFKDFEHFITIDQSGKVYKQVEQFLDGYFWKMKYIIYWVIWRWDHGQDWHIRGDLYVLIRRNCQWWRECPCWLQRRRSFLTDRPWRQMIHVD